MQVDKFMQKTELLTLATFHYKKSKATYLEKVEPVNKTKRKEHKNKIKSETE